MKINSDMNLGELAQHMGSEATLDDAQAMRDCMLERKLTGYDTSEIRESVWDLMLCEAFAIASAKQQS